MKYRWREISSGLNEGFPYDADWHHIVLTYDSVNFSFKMYVDNELKNEISLTPHGPGEGIFNLIKLESRAEASLIDNLKIYSGVLTENDISYLSTEK
jgi:hypothetical protein